MTSNLISFTVSGLPPKKDGANAMWGKSVERPRLIELRKAAKQAMRENPPFESNLLLRVSIYADSRAGDLDNFITGICDGLMAANKGFRLDPTAWIDVPEDVRPDKAIAFTDDRYVARIEAERFPPDSEKPYYKVELGTLLSLKDARGMFQGIGSDVQREEIDEER